jgi:hypothetical protein
MSSSFIKTQKMKLFLALALVLFIVSSCQNQTNNKPIGTPIEGTWKLLSGTLIEKGDTTITEYTGDLSMIKIINATHFSFLNHDLRKGSDSTAVFSAGGGRYTLSGDQYTEHLEYCSYRQWEGNTFPFTLTISGDTLVQQGVEKIEELGVERLNVEKYIRVRLP